LNAGGILILVKENQFETIKRLDDQGREYWSSRDLAKVLEYADYRNFLTAMNKAKVACENSGEVIHNHFVDANDMVKIGSGAEKLVDTIFLKTGKRASLCSAEGSDPPIIKIMWSNNFEVNISFLFSNFARIGE
jgi:DNA-damage-inducible protein D